MDSGTSSFIAIDILKNRRAYINFDITQGQKDIYLFNITCLYFDYIYYIFSQMKYIFKHTKGCFRTKT